MQQPTIVRTTNVVQSRLGRKSLIMAVPAIVLNILAFLIFLLLGFGDVLDALPVFHSILYILAIGGIGLGLLSNITAIKAYLYKTEDRRLAFYSLAFVGCSYVYYFVMVLLTLFVL